MFVERKLHYYVIIIGKTAPDDTWPPYVSSDILLDRSVKVKYVKEII